MGRVIELINPILRGWVNYFAVGHSSRCFAFIQDWVEKNTRRHLMRARKRRGFGWRRWSREWLYNVLGLFHGYRIRWLAQSATLRFTVLYQRWSCLPTNGILRADAPTRDQQRLSPSQVFLRVIGSPDISLVGRRAPVCASPGLAQGASAHPKINNPARGLTACRAGSNFNISPLYEVQKSSAFILQSVSPFQMAPAPANPPMTAWCLGVLVMKGFDGIAATDPLIH